jgi:hypothetical protein
VEKNKIEYRLSYRLVGAGSWTVDGAGWIDPPNTPSVIRFTGTALSTFGSAALGSAYEVLVEIRDVLATSSVQRTVPKAQVLLHLKGAIGVAFGARHSGAANPVEIWGRGRQASNGTTLNNILDIGDVASDAEAVAKSSTTKLLRPVNLAALGASETFAGFVERATNAEALAGDSTRFISGANLDHVLDRRVGTVPIVPSGVVVTGGSSSVSTNGEVNISGACTQAIIQGVFSAEFARYMVVGRALASDYLAARLSNGSSPLTSAVYSWQQLIAQLGVLYYAGGFYGSSQSSIKMAGSSGYNGSSFSMIITDPFVADETSFDFTGGWGGGSATVIQVHGEVNNNTSYSGLTILPFSGTMTDVEIMVYGLTD